jgi:DNA-binding NarL/FixJ family response regulator
VPVIVLTAKDLSAAERSALLAHVRTVVAKHGLDRDALVREVRQALAGASQ